MGTFFALGQLLLFWFEGAPTQVILSRVITGFVWFSLFGLLITFIHSQVVKGKAGSSSEDKFGVRQQTTLTLHLPYDRSFDLCCESVATLNGRIETADRSNGKIKATTGVTWKTFGCRVSYEIKPIAERLTEIEVTSRPKIPTALIDNGENLENVDRVCRFLSERDDRLDVNIMDAKLKNLSEAKLNQVGDIRMAVDHTKDNVKQP